MFFNNNRKKGFTLIEMVVSVGIFTMVMIIGMGALLEVINANKKAQAGQLVLDNMNYVMDGMSRSIRLGDFYYCGDNLNTNNSNDCGAGGSIFSFNSHDSSRIRYRLQDNRIEMSGDGGAYIPITAPDIKIDKLTFYVTGSSPSDRLQPRVLIVIKGNVKGGDVKKGTTFSLQTTISQRAFNF